MTRLANEMFRTQSGQPVAVRAAAGRRFRPGAAVDAVARRAGAWHVGSGRGGAADLARRGAGRAGPVAVRAAAGRWFRRGTAINAFAGRAEPRHIDSGRGGTARPARGNTRCTGAVAPGPAGRGDTAHGLRRFRRGPAIDAPAGCADVRDIASRGGGIACPARTGARPAGAGRAAAGAAGSPTPPSYYFLQDAGHGVPAVGAPRMRHPDDFDVNLPRGDFPILSERVNGRPLIWLDNGATTQKPRR